MRLGQICPVCGGSWLCAAADQAAATRREVVRAALGLSLLPCPKALTLAPMASEEGEA